MAPTTLDAQDHLDRPVLAIATSYPPCHLLDWHEHRRAQLLYGATGVMQVEARNPSGQVGAWTVPPQRAVVIPPRTPHRVRMLDVRTHSLYIEPLAVPWWPRECAVVEVSHLLRELLASAVLVEPEYQRPSRDDALMKLILHELATLTELPFHLVLPRDPQLAQLCSDYLESPDAAVANAEWAQRASMSERSLSRHFTAECGVGPAAWRVQARLLSALALLREQSVTAVAARLGYATPSAFSVAFRRAFGASPSSFTGAAARPGATTPR